MLRLEVLKKKKYKQQGGCGIDLIVQTTDLSKEQRELEKQGIIRSLKNIVLIENTLKFSLLAC